MKVFLDLDGVISDFDKQLCELLGKPLDRDYDFGNDPKVWAKIDKAGEKFWSSMKWMPDGHELWDAIKKYDPIILSSPSNHPTSVEGKKIWLKENLPGVPYHIEKHKEKYADKDSILIDDREKNIKKWESASGIGILHKNAKNTIDKLEKIMERNDKEASKRVVEDPTGRRVIVPMPRMQDTFTTQQRHTHRIPPLKGKGSKYDRREFKRIELSAARVVLAYLRSSIESTEKIVDIGEKRMEHYHQHPKILLDKDLLDKIRKEYVGEYKGVKFYFVDGDLLRERIDIDYTLGGNPGRYTYIPEGNVWSEKIPEKKDHTPVFIHEYKEMRKMIDHGWSYDKAHEYASGLEKKYRLQDRTPSNNPLDDFKEYMKNHPDR